MHAPSWLTQKAWDTLDLRSKRAQTWTLSLKELATWSLLFSRASASCLVFIFNFQWLLVIFFFVLTGRYHKFGFGFYDISSKSPDQAIFQCSVWQNSEGDIGSSCFRWESISSLLSNLWQRRRKKKHKFKFGINLSNRYRAKPSDFNEVIMYRMITIDLSPAWEKVNENTSSPKPSYFCVRTIRHPGHKQLAIELGYVPAL